MNEDNSDWSSVLSSDMIVKVLMPLSAMAFLTGTGPTDATMLLYLQRTQGFSEDAAVAAVSIKTYSAIAFTIPVILFILVGRTRFTILSGVLSYLLFLGFSIRQTVPELTQLGFVFAGYAAAAWIACCCCGRFLLPEDYFLLYYPCIACACLVGQLVSKLLDAFVLEPFVSISTVLYLALGTGTLNLVISIFWIPTQKHIYTPQGVFEVAAGTRASCPGNGQYWCSLGSALAEAMKIRALRRLVVWYMLEYGIYLSIQESIADYMSSGGIDALNTTVGGYLLAGSVACGALATACTVLMRTEMSHTRAEQLIAIVSFFSNMEVVVLTFGQDLPPVYIVAFITLTLATSFQFTLAVVNIAIFVHADVNVILFGAMWLVSKAIKTILTNLLPLDAQAIVCVVIWCLVNVGYTWSVFFGSRHAQVVPQVVVASRTSEIKDDAELSISQAPQNEISVASEVQP